MTVRKEEPMNLGSYLKSLRLARNYTLRDVEKKSGISSPFLSQLESGKVKKPSPMMLYKLAREYDVMYEDLMERAGHPVSQPDKNNPTSQDVLHRLGPISEEEVDSLAEYLSFLRSRSYKERSRK